MGQRLFQNSGEGVFWRKAEFPGEHPPHLHRVARALGEKSRTGVSLEGQYGPPATWTGTCLLAGNTGSAPKGCIHSLCVSPSTWVAVLGMHG